MLRILRVFFLIIPLFLSLRGYAGRVEIINYSSNPSLFNASFNLTRNADAAEYQDLYDLQPPAAPPGPVLKAYSKPYGTPLGIDCRPETSITEIELYLAFDGSVAAADNSLRFQVLNSAAFEHRIIKAQQTFPAAGPVHTLPKDGSVYSVDLPDLANPDPGVYAIWHITLERILEGDLDENGRVDFMDFFLFANEWLGLSDEQQNGGNYLVSDTDLNRTTVLKDLLPVIHTWMMNEEE